MCAGRGFGNVGKSKPSLIMHGIFILAMTIRNNMEQVLKLKLDLFEAYVWARCHDSLEASLKCAYLGKCCLLVNPSL